MTEQELRDRKAERYIKKCRRRREAWAERATVAALAVIGLVAGISAARR